MRSRAQNRSIQAAVAILVVLAPIGTANALSMADGMADPSLAYETIEPSRIRLGDSAIMRVTSLDGYLKNITLPSVAGLDFQILGRSQGLEFVNGKSITATYIIIKVTPRFLGVFTIPGLTPKARTLGLEVVTGNEPNPYAYRSPTQPKPLPVAPALVPKGVQLKANGAAFVQLIMPPRPVYVGESVPVDIEVGIRPGIVTSLNGPPTLTSSDFTLNNLSRQPVRREQVIEGSTFVVMTWHTLLGAVKPGDFPLSVQAPLSVRDTRSTEDMAIASKLGWPFSQIMYNGITPKDETVPSPGYQVKVLPLPVQDQPKDFSGAVGDFQASTDLSPSTVAVGEPVTLRLHIRGAGNFDRVYPPMLDHLDHWKTYPVKSSFKPKDALGYDGEKVFEQPLIAALSGEQTIPPLEFSYFNPKAQRYERVRTDPLKVTIAASLADGLPAVSSTGPSLGGSLTNAAGAAIRGLRPDHAGRGSEVSDLRPVYFQTWFLAIPTTLALVFAGSWFAIRPDPIRARSKLVERALARLGSVARAGDAAAFFVAARQELLTAYAARWHMTPEQITGAELKARLGSSGEEIARLFSLADEAKYSNDELVATDFQRWLTLIRTQLTGMAA